MRILLTAPLGIPSNWGLWVGRALSQLGYEVKAYDYRQVAGKMGVVKANLTYYNVAKDLKPDVFLAVKGELLHPKTVEQIRKLGVYCALWSPDDFQIFDQVVKYLAPEFNHVFTTADDYIPRYRLLGVEASYLGWGFDPEIHKPVNPSQEERNLYGSDVCFIGTRYPRREPIVDALKKQDFDFKLWGSDWPDTYRLNIYDMVTAFRCSKIVLNIHQACMLNCGSRANLRVYEALGSKCFLLTDRPKGLEKHFKDGKHLVTYSDMEDLLDKIRYYLEYPEERGRIARLGHKHASLRHKMVDRVREMMGVVEGEMK